MYGYIYKFTVKDTGKIYVGKHKFDKEELDENYWGGGIAWKNVLKKYGKNSIVREVLEYCDDLDTLNTREKYWIEYLNATDKLVGYNISIGGDGNPWQKGMPRSEESKIKNSLTHIELYKDESYHKKVSDGTKLAMSREDIKNKLIGRKLSDDHKKKLSDAAKGKNNPNWNTHWTDDRKKKAADTRANSEKWKNHINTIGDKLRGIPKSRNHRESLSLAKKGKCLYTNGIENHYYFEGTEPTGYYRKRKNE